MESRFCEGCGAVMSTDEVDLIATRGKYLCRDCQAKQKMMFMPTQEIRKSDMNPQPPAEAPAKSPRPTSRIAFRCNMCSTLLSIKPIEGKSQLTCPKCRGILYVFPDGRVESKDQLAPQPVADAAMEQTLDIAGAPPEPPPAPPAEDWGLTLDIAPPPSSQPEPPPAPPAEDWSQTLDLATPPVPPPEAPPKKKTARITKKTRYVSRRRDKTEVAAEKEPSTPGRRSVTRMLTSPEYKDVQAKRGKILVAKFVCAVLLVIPLVVFLVLLSMASKAARNPGDAADSFVEKMGRMADRGVRKLNKRSSLNFKAVTPDEEEKVPGEEEKAPGEEEKVPGESAPPEEDAGKEESSDEGAAEEKPEATEDSE